MWKKNNKPPRPSNNNNNRSCNKMFVVPSSSQGSVCVFGDEDTYSDLNTDFGGPFSSSCGGVSDDDDVVFPKLWPPMDSQNHYAKGAVDSDYLKWIEDFVLADDERLGYQSSETNCFSIATSRGGATASASRNGPFSLETEEDAVDSLPQPLHQDKNGELNNHTVNDLSSEMINSNKETTVQIDGAFWADASVDPQNNFNLIEVDYNAETPQPDETLGIYNCKRKYKMSQLMCPSQSKKYLDHIWGSDSDVITRKETFCNLLEERCVEDIKAPDSSLFLGDASRPLSSARGQSISLESHNSHVRFKIKSFTVPEFFVEVPETASVGFLKNAIMEKATAMVGDGGNLGVILLGENIGDENEMLPKTGISHQNKLDVIFEPQCIQDLNGLGPHRSCIPLPLQPQTWGTPLSSAPQGITDASPNSLMSILGTIYQDNRERLEYQTDMPIVSDTIPMAVITCPAGNGASDRVYEHQKVVSKCKKRLVMHVNDHDETYPKNDHDEVSLQKSKLPMKLKRRKTEFFSISEAEALVQTVEELGPGRWQKIKEQAFGNDSRRTYMDVKDKWRSLVKTAKRPVDERRGVFLSQGLLDRVLAIETCKLKRKDI